MTTDVEKPQNEVPSLEPTRSINSVITQRIEEKITVGGYQLFQLNKDKKLIIIKSEIVRFIHDFSKTVTFNDKIYAYDPDKGVYVPGEGIINAVINEICNICGHPSSIKTVQGFAGAHLKGINLYTTYPFNQTPNRIPFSNCTIRLVGNEWVREDVKPEDMVTWRLNVRYDPDVSIDNILSVLTEWVAEDDVKSLINIPAQALLQMTCSQPYKRNYLLLGEHDAGKSTYIDLLQAFFGTDRCAEVPLQLIGTRFKNAELEGKLLNIYDDLSDKEINNLGAFKKLTGRFQHPIERKGQDSYEGLIKCVHVFSCNKPPQLNITDDDAFYSRWQPLLFPNSFPRDPLWFTKNVTPSVLSGFANLILLRYIELIGNGLETDQTIEEIKNFWLRESMPEYAFIKDCLEEGIGFTLQIAECYELYKDWMIKVRLVNPSRVKDPVWFGRAMNKSQLIKSGQETITKGIRIDVYKGVRKKVKAQQ